MIKRHWPTLILAVALGFLMVLPFFYFQISLGGEYKGILNQVIDDELFYMARVKDVMDSHSTLGNAYLWEHKNQLPQQLFLPEWLSAQPLKFLNLDIIQGRVLYNFILPTLAFILTYAAFYFIYPSRFGANVFAVFLFFGIFLFKFTRPVIPQFVFLFWLSQFILLWQLVKTKHNDIMIYHCISKRWVLLLNVFNFGLLFYLYPFYWTFYLVFLAILSFLYFFREKFLSKKFLIILLGGLLVGSFYFYLTFLASRLPEYMETLTRLQLVFSRSPSEIKTVLPALIVLILVGILYRLKAIKINREILFFVAGIISIFLVTNQNIITGQKFEFGHYRMPAMFFLAFAVYCLGSQIFESLNYKLKFFAASLAIIVSVYGISGYIQRFFDISEQDIYNQNYSAVFDFLNQNTVKDSVVYADNNLSELIPVYTSNNIFYTRTANLFFISDQEVLERFVLNNFFEKFDRDFILRNERAIFGVRYVDKYADTVQSNKWRGLLGLKLKPEVRLPEEEVDKVLIKAKEIQKDSFEKGLKNYRVDYLIWDREKDFHWKISVKEFKKAADIGQFSIFAMN